MPDESSLLGLLFEISADPSKAIAATWRSAPNTHVGFYQRLGARTRQWSYENSKKERFICGCIAYEPQLKHGGQDPSAKQQTGGQSLEIGYLLLTPGEVEARGHFQNIGPVAIE